MTDAFKRTHIIDLPVILDDSLFFCCFYDLFIIILIKTAHMEFHIGMLLLQRPGCLQKFVNSLCLHDTGNVCKDDLIIDRILNGNKLFQIDTGAGKNVITVILDALFPEESAVLQVLEEHTACRSHTQLVKKHQKLLTKSPFSQSFSKTGDVGDIGNLQNPAGHAAVNGAFNGIGQNHIRLDLFDQFHIASQQGRIPKDIGTSAVNEYFDMAAAVFFCLLLTLTQNTVWKGYYHFVPLGNQPLNQLATHSENNKATISQYQYSLSHIAQTPVILTCGRPCYVLIPSLQKVDTPVCNHLKPITRTYAPDLIY